MILIEVGLEGRCGSHGLVAEGSAGASHEVVVVFGHAVLALLHAPEDKSDAAEEEGTANTADNAADDLLVGLAQTAATVVTGVLRCGRLGDQGLAGCGGDGA